LDIRLPVLDILKFGSSQLLHLITDSESLHKSVSLPLHLQLNSELTQTPFHSLHTMQPTSDRSESSLCQNAILCMYRALVSCSLLKHIQFTSTQRLQPSSRDVRAFIPSYHNMSINAQAKPLSDASWPNSADTFSR